MYPLLLCQICINSSSRGDALAPNRCNSLLCTVVCYVAWLWSMIYRIIPLERRNVRWSSLLLWLGWLSKKVMQHPIDTCRYNKIWQCVGSVTQISKLSKLKFKFLFKFCIQTLTLYFFVLKIFLGLISMGLKPGVHTMVGIYSR